MAAFIYFLVFAAGGLFGYLMFTLALPRVMASTLKEHEGKKILVATDDGNFLVNITRFEDEIGDEE